MPIVIKPDRDRDFYVGWSNVTDSPIWWGPRTEVTAYLAEETAAGDRQSQPEVRLARADERGTSSYIGDGAWHDEGFIYEQRGWLPRRHLAEVCRLLEAENEPAVWDLLEPFEDGMEVRRG